jgi:hypothetical protein
LCLSRRCCVLEREVGHRFRRGDGVDSSRDKLARERICKDSRPSGDASGADERRCGKALRCCQAYRRCNKRHQYDRGPNQSSCSERSNRGGEGRRGRSRIFRRRGRGEVPAEQTTKAAGEVAQQISSIQSATEESISAIKEITETINRVSEISSTVAVAVEEQGQRPSKSPSMFNKRRRERARSPRT